MSRLVELIVHTYVLSTVFELKHCYLENDKSFEWFRTTILNDVCLSNKRIFQRSHHVDISTI
jgi:hypothetical protein